MSFFKKIGKGFKSVVKGAGKFVKKSLPFAASAASSLLPGGGLLSSGLKAANTLINPSRMPKGAQGAAHRANQSMMQGKGGYNPPTSAQRASAGNKEKEVVAKKSSGGSGGLLAGAVALALLV